MQNFERKFNLPNQSVANIFKYLNIFVTNVYSDINSYQFFLSEYIRTFVRAKFVCSNIFRHSFVNVLECKNKTNICTIFITNIYLDICSCQIIHTNICGY